MDLVGTLHDVRYCSKILHCIFPINLIDTEVKVTDLEILL